MNIDKIFHFKFTNKELIENLLELKSQRLDEYYKIMDIAERVKYFVEKENLDGLQTLLTRNLHYVHFLRRHIEWAFDYCLRNNLDNFLCFFIKHGFSLKETQAIFQLIESSRFFPSESNTDILKVFLENGASANVLHDKTYKSPIHYAAEYGLPEFVEVLIKFGANVNSFDKKKRLAINYAIEHKEEGERFKKVIEILGQNGSLEGWSNPDP